MNDGSYNSGNQFIAIEGIIRARAVYPDKVSGFEFGGNKFLFNKEFDCYTLKDHGAYMGMIGSEDRLKDYQEYMDKGYELVLGPPVCGDSTKSYGVYCSNYQSLARGTTETSVVR